MKNRKALYYLLGANAVSGFAQGISMIAIPWYFINVLSESTFYGIIYAIITMLTLPWSLYAGTLIDRYPRKNIFLALCICGALVLGSVSASGFAMGEVNAALVALVFGFTIFNYNVHFPTLYAFGQEITEKQHYGRTNSMLEIQHQLTTMLSGGMAAVLLTGTSSSHSFLKEYLPFEIEAWELHEIFLLDAITYVIAFSLISMIRYTPPVDKKVDTGKIWDRFVTGLQFLKKNSKVTWFGVASYTVFIVLLIHSFYIVSIYVKDHLHQNADVYAVGEMIYCIGAVTAGLFIRKIFKNVNVILSVLILMFITIGIFWMCAFTNSVTVLYLFCITIGLTNAGIRILRITYLFNHIPNHIIGRANSVFNSSNIILRAAFIGLFTLPFFHSDNIVWGYFICGLFVLISIFPILYFYKGLVKKEKELEEVDG
jgi:DHA3 family macrolide efflux protein-like MFS transporter